MLKLGVAHDNSNLFTPVSQRTYNNFNVVNCPCFSLMMTIAKIYL